ncbi:unnamed protein product [Prorocentrum cordatum]|uniref:Uncharacterized protein n=1 Tax=Prorocentrum cordatum TaxID=2364126 RepID=A0ABN9QS86_9DINO|nr:unnamed protein product [Polarella glacialis]
MAGAASAANAAAACGTASNGAAGKGGAGGPDPKAARVSDVSGEELRTILTGMNRVQLAIAATPGMQARLVAFGDRIGALEARIDAEPENGNTAMRSESAELLKDVVERLGKLEECRSWGFSFNTSHSITFPNSHPAKPILSKVNDDGLQCTDPASQRHFLRAKPDTPGNIREANLGLASPTPRFKLADVGSSLWLILGKGASVLKYQTRKPSARLRRSAAADARVKSLTQGLSGALLLLALKLGSWVSTGASTPGGRLGAEMETWRQGQWQWRQWQWQPGAQLAVDAVQGVLRCASSLGLANCVGMEAADVVQHEATATLQKMLDAAEAEAAPAKRGCLVAAAGLASACLDLVEAVDLDLAAKMDECFQEGRLVVWGFSVGVAEAVAFSLAAVVGAAASSEADLQDAEAAACLEKLCLDVDCISMHVFGGLCRMDAVDGEEARLVHAFQCICVWSLALVFHFTNRGELTSEALWEWASGDPTWALVLAKGVLLYDPSGQPDAALPVPEHLAFLREAVVAASTGLCAPAIAFRDELDADVIVVRLWQRSVGLALHRARLAVAASDSSFLCAVLRGALQRDGANASCLPALASFLASLTKSADHLFSLAEAQGVADAFSEEVCVHSSALWGLLSEVPRGCSAPTGARFLVDCASLAFAAPPCHEACAEFLRGCFEGFAGPDLDPSRLAPLLALAVNAGLAPRGGDALAGALGALAPEQRGRVAERLGRCRIPLRPSAVQPLWAAPPPARSGPEAAPAAGARRPGLREILGGAPAELCCSLDGRLLRAGLARALAAAPGRCPLSGLPLALEDCWRDGGLRARAARWVREARPRQQPP